MGCRAGPRHVPPPPPVRRSRAAATLFGRRERRRGQGGSPSFEAQLPLFGGRSRLGLCGRVRRAGLSEGEAERTSPGNLHGAGRRPQGAGRGCGALPPGGRGRVCRGARSAALRDRCAARLCDSFPGPPAGQCSVRRQGARGPARPDEAAAPGMVVWNNVEGERSRQAAGWEGRAGPDTRSPKAPQPGPVAAERGLLRRGGQARCPGTAAVLARPAGPGRLYVTVTSLPSAMARPARFLTGRPAEAPREDWSPRPCPPRREHCSGRTANSLSCAGASPAFRRLAIH